MKCVQRFNIFGAPMFEPERYCDMSAEDLSNHRAAYHKNSKHMRECNFHECSTDPFEAWVQGTLLEAKWKPDTSVSVVQKTAITTRTRRPRKR